MTSVAEVLIGCCGWNYGDRFEKGGWVGSFYTDSKTKRLSYYSRIFSVVEFDAIFYEKFYSKMGRGTFYGMVKATPEKFDFSVKVPETITHDRRLDINKGSIEAFGEFVDRISPLQTAKKLGAILIQLPPSFSVNDFRKVESFLDKLPRGYDYAVEFRHPSWQTEGPWELLNSYNVAAVLTDSPEQRLQFLSDVTVTADHVFIRLHGRKKGYWYDYLYSEEELRPWAKKVKTIEEIQKVKRLRVLFNNHNRGSAPLNAIQFKEMLGEKLSGEEKAAKSRISYALSSLNEQTKLG